MGQRLFWSPVLFGAGLMGSLDAVAFHHLLRWHNLYVHGGSEWRSVSDGLLHLFTTTLMFGGAVALLPSGRYGNQVVTGRAFWAGTAVGMGAFQLLDGIVFHKLLRLHPVREGVENLLPYDALWLASALLLLLCGWLLLPRSARR